MKVEINQEELEIEGSSGYVIITYFDEHDGILKAARIQKDNNIDFILMQLFDVFFPEFVAGNEQACSNKERMQAFEDIREILRDLITPKNS